MSDAEIFHGWYVSHDDELDGPFDDAELAHGVETGRYKAHHFVWRDGMDLWVEAGKLPQLIRIFSARREPSVQDAFDKRSAERRDVKAERAENRQQQRSARRASPGGMRPPTLREKVKPPAEIALPVDLKEAMGKLGSWKNYWPQLAIGAVILALIFPGLLPFILFAAWIAYSMNKKAKQKTGNG
ncbi:MAG: DUF4339 domain-containing protein [Hyphomicrobiaceae bacterium]|nr:DUF4339 domain-containing protein [Hyphomicrobiaceae bacterium]